MKILEDSFPKEIKNRRLNPYSTDEKDAMKTLFNMLSEKHKRLYAGAEAIKLPHGGITYIADILGCDRKTVRQGILELKNPGLFDETDRIRKAGGGRKESIETGAFLKSRISTDYTSTGQCSFFLKQKHDKI